MKKGNSRVAYIENIRKMSTKNLKLKTSEKPLENLWFLSQTLAKGCSRILAAPSWLVSGDFLLSWAFGALISTPKNNAFSSSFHSSVSRMIRLKSSFTVFRDSSDVFLHPLLKEGLLNLFARWSDRMWSLIECDLRCYITVLSWNSKMRKKFSKRFLRGFRFSNVVLLKRTTFENLWKTSKRFLKGSRSPEVFQRFFGGFWSTFFVYFRC